MTSNGSKWRRASEDLGGDDFRHELKGGVTLQGVIVLAIWLFISQ